MKRTVFVMLSLLLGTAFASAPDTLWTRTYGGTNDDVGRSMQLTPDGGCIIAGYTRSFGAGGSDVWLLKVDAQGDTEWTRTYGGASDDEAYSVDLTFDGGYIVAGMTRSFGAGGSDIWLLKVAASGDTDWTRTYGDTRDDTGHSVLTASDSGYVVAGQYGSRAYLAKTSRLGDTLWTRTFVWGAPGGLCANSVRETPDRGYIVAAEGSNGADWVCRLVKTDTTGDLVWAWSHWDLYEHRDVELGSGGGYVHMFRRYVRPGVWLQCLRGTDSLGGESWSHGVIGLWAGSIRPTSDKGYIVVGRTEAPAFDLCMARFDSVGDSLWTKVIGGDSEDVGYSCQQTADSGFMVAGSTRSFGAGGTDVWLIRLEPEQIGVQETPNAKLRTTNVGATVLRRLPAGAVVFDAMGRRAANPKPGVYFVREAQAQAQAVRKVVVTR